MGRFYDTSAPAFVDDAMFKLPFEQMGRVLLAKDEKIGGDIEATTALGELLQAQGLDVDKPIINRKIQEYENQIQSTVDNIRGNVLNYDPTEIGKLKRTIHEDWTRGEIAGIQGNKAAFDADMARWREQQKKNPELYTEEYISKLAEQSLNKYTTSGGINYKGPDQYNKYSGMSATGLEDLNKWVDEALKGALPNFTSATRDTDQGRWLVTQGNSTKEMTDQEINEILQRRFKGDVNLQAALKQRGEFGMEGFTNLFDEKGEFLPSIGFDEQGRTMYADNYLGNSFKGGIEKFGFKETTTTHKMQETDKWKKEYDYTLAKNKEIEDAAYITVEDNDTLVTNTGVNLADFTKRNKGFREEKETSLAYANTIAMKSLKYESEEEFKKGSPKIYEAIQKEDFNSLPPELLTPEMQSIAKRRKIANFEQKSRNAFLLEFQDRELNGAKYDHTNPEHVKRFSLAIQNNGLQSGSTKAGWDIMGPSLTHTPKEVKSIQEQVAPLLPSLPLKLKPGTSIVVTGPDGKKQRVDISKYGSVQDLIEAGYAKPYTYKAGEQLTGGVTTIAGVMGQTTVAILADGTKINFDLSQKSLMPRVGNSDKIELQITGNLGGNPFVSTIKNISTQKMGEFNQQNRVSLTGSTKLKQIGNGSVTFDNGVIYHGSAGNQKRIAGAANAATAKDFDFSEGWVEIPLDNGGYKIHSIKESGIRQQIYEELDRIYN
jgi:hypothetical protein